MNNRRKKMIPALRFSEFESNGEWGNTIIGSLGSFYYGKSAPKWSLSEDAKTPCVRYGELYTKFGPVIREVYSRTNIEPEKLRFSKGGEILVPRVGEKPEDFGKCCCYLPLEGVAIGEMISVFETKENPLFYTYYFKSMYRQFAKVVEGQNVKNLYYKELEPLPIGITSPKEQKKIADCLLSLDDLILTQNEKIKSLKRYKNALLQQLFPHNGKAVPSIRFSEFANRKKWDEKPMKDVFSLEQGYAFSSKDSVSNGVRWLKIADVGLQKMTPKSPSFLPEEHKNKFEKSIVNKGDYVMALTRPILSGELKIAQVDDEYDGALLNQRVAKIVTSNDQSFIYFLLQKSNIVEKIEKNIAGAEPPNLSSKHIEKINIYIPERDEQEKIAKVLSSLDLIITNACSWLENLTQHQTGLLQQLFPQLEGDH
ncbi:restriction endonuclease subunit S [Halobacteriovorax sp. JY17]|uniref:restriction endonuclease subunit S n=1 Tax=Halobacteriovorax sp. JY17 TaxID=2014617 RepID=UPI000C5CDFD4|nr:restriction endonuclease subunit S [Halobacteriovorax sp. JY17]PIK14393.1 MAG: restriction endonuclease [Halobacteriovorax sp. JY17]